MKFPLASFAGKDFGLLLIEPDWGGGLQISHRYDTLIGEGRTSIEERRPERAGLYLSSLKWRLTALDQEADDWRKGVAALGNRPVAVPLWIDALPVADWSARIYDPKKVINFDRDSGAYAIYDAGSLPGSPAYPLYAPLVLCRWKERPPAQAESSNRAGITLELAEAREWAWRIGINPYGAGWSAEPYWNSPLKDLSQHGLEILAINPAVAPALDRTATAPRWLEEASFTFADRLEIRQALSFFVEKKGARDAWSPVPAWFQPGTPAPETPASYTARFASDTLALTYKSDSIAEARIGFIQEVAGSQALAAEAYLYQFSYAHDAADPELYTNWEAPIVAAEGAYQPAQIAHTEIIRSLKPQDEKAERRLAYAAGGLMADWILGRLFGVVTLTIWKCDPANPAGRGDPVFEGIVKTVTPEGNTLTITATLFGTLLERRVPGWVYGPRCNTYVFSSLCGLSETAWRSAGTASPGDLSADGRSLAVHGSGAWPANRFAGGILRTGSGRATQIATIVESSADAGGIITVKLNRPIWPDLISANQAVQLVPGCDGQASTCKTKFTNYLNFRGHPFIPDYLATHDVAAPSTPKK